MKTEIKAITSDSLDEAKKIIFDGGVVGMPTETVYGLGGNAFNDDAVKRIFAVRLLTHKGARNAKRRIRKFI